ncbi:hypothetical protein ACFE04_015767 [Oxalis oulophora]
MSDIKEEFKAVAHTQHDHGKRDEHTPSNHVKAPNVFDRAEEEIEAIVQTIHHKNGTRDQLKMTSELDSTKKEKDAKASNLFERVKEEFEAIVHHHDDKSPHRHDKETHGQSEDIDEKTAIDDVRGPNVFERVKEEVEALVEAIHHKK